MQNETSPKDNSKEIAQTIIAQIKSIDFWFLAAIGYNSPSFYKNTLSFKVKGLKVGNAFVSITSNSMDTYDVKVFKIRKFEKIELGKMENVYWDSLVECLKTLVEGD